MLLRIVKGNALVKLLLGWGKLSQCEQVRSQYEVSFHQESGILYPMGQDHALIQATGDFASFLESYPLGSVRYAHEEWRGAAVRTAHATAALPRFLVSSFPRFAFR